MCFGMAAGAKVAGVVSIFCLVMEELSKESRSRSWMEDGREELEVRPKESIVELLRTALFNRPVHLGFGLPPLMLKFEKLSR